MKIKTQLFLILFTLALFIFAEYAKSEVYEPEILKEGYTQEELKKEILQCVVRRMSDANTELSLMIIIEYCEIETIKKEE